MQKVPFVNCLTRNENLFPLIAHTQQLFCVRCNHLEDDSSGHYLRPEDAPGRKCIAYTVFSSSFIPIRTELCILDCLSIVLWRPRHWNLLEKQRTPLIKVHMRQQPPNVLERPRARVVPNQSMPRVRTLADQSDRGSDLRIQPGQVLLRTLTLSASGVALRLLVRRLSRPTVPSSLLYTFVLVTVNTQSLSNQHFPLLSLGAQLILETTRRYCWRLVFLGI